MTIRIVIADDHKVVRQGLRLFLHVDPELTIVGEASNGVEALALARELRPDVVLMDGVAATEAIRHELPDTEVLALTSVLEDAAVVEIMRAGAIGYLLKDVDGDELGVLAGGVVLAALGWGMGMLAVRMSMGMLVIAVCVAVVLGWHGVAPCWSPGCAPSRRRTARRESAQLDGLLNPSSGVPR